MPARMRRQEPDAASGGDVTQVRFGPAADRRHAEDRAHRGDVEGAFGVISALDTGPRHGDRRRLAALSAVLGPGLVVMAADNDARRTSPSHPRSRAWPPPSAWWRYARR